MSNKRITDLTELTNPTTDDVFPVVDIATNTTTKVQLGNLPVQTAVTTALATKQDTLVSGTNIKTVNSTSLVGSGNVAVQETLVSGTNIKTLNSVSLLGAGNIVLAATPSGVSGAIQFSNGSAFASDASNLFWDDTNKRLGVGTNVPASQLEIKGNSDASFQISGGTAGRRALFTYFNAPSVLEIDVSNILRIKNGSTYSLYTDNTGNVGIGTLSPSARTHIQGSGSTSATTSLLVQNSAGTAGLEVKDDGDITNGADGNTNLKFTISPTANKFFRLTRQSINVDFYAGSAGNSAIETSGGAPFLLKASSAALTLSNGGVRIASAYGTTNASAQLEVVSTTKGFLPPVMTTTQKNAIASPATGLVLYDSTTNKLQCYNGSTWNDLF
jgi:hypothetical protein